MNRKIAAIALFTSFGFGAVAQNTVHIQGADTLILLSQRWAQLYKQRQPALNIAVQGGGATAAMRALSEGRATVAQFEGGTRPVGGLTFPVGVEGIAVYVNRSNPVSEVTVDQLKKIFLGEITNWKDLGGPDKRILLYAGESSTGVIPYFQSAVLQDAEPYPFEGKASAKDLIATVAGQPSAIGYSSVYPSNDAKILRVKATSGAPAIEATIENIRSRKYPLSRYVYWRLAGRPSGELKSFCQWVLSREGQLVVESVGYEPLTPEDRASGLAKLQ